MFRKWQKDYRDLLKRDYKRPLRWYDCRNKYSLIIGGQQIPCRSLRCTSFHCNYARVENEAKKRLARFFLIKPNICAVVKFEKLPFILDDCAMSKLKSCMSQKLNYQRKIFYPFEVEYKMELDSKLKPHLHLSIKDLNFDDISKSVANIKEILKKAAKRAAKRAVFEILKIKNYPEKELKISVYCDAIKDLKKYANYISKRGMHLKKLVVFPESWNPKNCRVTSSTKGFKPLNSKDLLTYYFKNKTSIINWCRPQNNKQEESKPLKPKSSCLEPFINRYEPNKKTTIKLQNKFVFSTFKNIVWKSSLNILMVIFLAVFSLYLIKNERLETEKINKVFSDLEFKLKQRNIAQAAIKNNQNVYLLRNDFHQKE